MLNDINELVKNLNNDNNIKNLITNLNDDEKLKQQQQQHQLEDKEQVKLSNKIDENSINSNKKIQSSNNNNKYVPKKSDKINEFKSVKNLKTFWDKRIQSNHNNFNNNNENKNTKTTNVNDDKKLILLKKQQSFNLSDNFNKYKTAQTVKVNQQDNSQLPNQHQQHPVASQDQSADINKAKTLPHIVTSSGGGKIHWIKKNYISMKDNLDKILINDGASSIKMTDNKLNIVKDATTTAEVTQNTIKKLSKNEKQQMATLSKLQKQQSTDKITAMKNNKHYNINVSDKLDSIGRGASSTASSLSSVSTTNTTGTPTRKPSRKCSFKTNQSNYKNNMAIGGNGSTVALLTYRFNQLIKQDATILNEVNKKNGTIINTGSHIYKIKENIDNNSSVKRKHKKIYDDLINQQMITKKRPSIIKKRFEMQAAAEAAAVAAAKTKTPQTAKTDSVKERILKFEPTISNNNKTDHLDEQKVIKKTINKPKVPDKSEIVIKNSNKIKLSNSNNNINSNKVNNIVPNLNNNNNKCLDNIDKKIYDKSLINDNNNINVKSEELISDNVNVEKFNKNNKKIYSKIYEKILRKTLPIKSDEKKMGKQSKTTVTGEEKRDNDEYELKKIIINDRITPSLNKIMNNNDDDDEEANGNFEKISEKHLIETLETLDKKIDYLSKSFNDLTKTIKTQDNLIMKPNDSFLFRTTLKNSLTTFDVIEIINEENDKNGIETLLKPIEALNQHLINKKTQSMDEIVTATINQSKLYKNYAENELKIPIEINTNNYEVIKKDELLENNYNVYDVNNENIYHTLPYTDDLVVKNSNNNVNDDDDISRNEHNYDDNYERIDEIKEKLNKHNNSNLSILTDDGYEICKPPTPPPPRLSTTIIHNSNNSLTGLTTSSTSLATTTTMTITPTSAITTIVSNNISNPPDLPLPKRRTNDCNYEKIHKKNNNKVTENIYDSLKTNDDHLNGVGNCYESCIYNNHLVDAHAINNDDHNNVNNNNNINDTISLISNCYESITSSGNTPNKQQSPNNNHLNEYDRRNHILWHSDSTSTISSEIKTNSLYGRQLNNDHVNNKNFNNHGNNSLQSDNDDDDDDDDDNENSDNDLNIIDSNNIIDSEDESEWIDMSDEEQHKRFIVVRKKTKCHRSPDWSRRVREQRNLQISEEFEDDCDHHYETLYANGEKLDELNDTKADKKSNFVTKLDNDDDFDSFDSEDDEYDDDDINNKKNDSGVDISNARLPDPPQTTGQMYAFMQKITKSISRITKGKKPLSNKNTSDDQTIQIYDNQTLPKRVKQIKDNYNSVNTANDNNYDVNSKVLSQQQQQQPQQTSSNDISSPKITVTNYDTINRKKSGKNFKTKFRKSLSTTTTTLQPDQQLNIGNTISGTRSTFYVSDTIDIDSGIYADNDSKKASTSAIDLVLQQQHEQQQKQQQSDGNNTLKAVIAPVKRRNRFFSTSMLKDEGKKSPTRPSNPPPPPPSTLHEKRLGTTSWYAECGVFKTDANNKVGNLSESQVKLDNGRREKSLSTTTSWYAETGLYQTSGDSVISSGSSGISTSFEGPTTSDENSHSMFINEPLYQIYNAAKLESIRNDIQNHCEEDGYEEIGSLHDIHQEDDVTKPITPTRPSALELVDPRTGPSRTLWCEIPEVINSEILSTLTKNEKRLQETKFEVITSEASYLKSLNLLKTHFMNHPAFRDNTLISTIEHKSLFAHIIPIINCSDHLLDDLEKCWQDNIMLLGLSHSLYKNAEKNFRVYIKYCENQGKMDRTLKRLKETKPTFGQILENLESDPVLCGLSLHSFLMLPMQRITRLPLLIDAVLSKLKYDDDEYESWKMTLAMLNKIVSQCNEAANKSEQAYEMEIISRQIEFPTNISPLAIIPVGIASPGAIPRTLVRRGELTQLIYRGDDGKLTFGKKISRTHMYAFLFTDLLVLTKKKSETSYLVVDYCQRSVLTITSGDFVPQLPSRNSLSFKHLVVMALLENYEGKPVELVFSCSSESDRQRWLQAVEPPVSTNPDEVVYEAWDCPQVIAKHEYHSKQPDELNLDVSDVVNVTRKLVDGWYHGERIRDGAKGWFPGNYTEEVASLHVRARNLKQRHRLLTFTATYLESQKKK